MSLLAKQRGKDESNSRDVGLRQRFSFTGEKEHFMLCGGCKVGVWQLHSVMCESEGGKKQLCDLSQSWQSRNGLTCSLTIWEGYKCHVDVFQE